MHILRCMGSKFCVKFQRGPLKFHTKFWTHTLQNVHFTVLYFCAGCREWVTTVAVFRSPLCFGGPLLLWACTRSTMLSPLQALWVAKMNQRPKSTFWLFLNQEPLSCRSKLLPCRQKYFTFGLVSNGLLIHCGPLTTYGDKDLGQNWFRQWLVARRRQAITRTNFELSSAGSLAVEWA